VEEMKECHEQTLKPKISSGLITNICLLEIVRPKVESRRTTFSRNALKASKGMNIRINWSRHVFKKKKKEERR